MCIRDRSSRDDTKFGFIGDSNRQTNNYANMNTNVRNTQKKGAAMVHLSLDTT